MQRIDRPRTHSVRRPALNPALYPSVTCGALRRRPFQRQSKRTAYRLSTKTSRRIQLVMRPLRHYCISEIGLSFLPLR